MLTLNINGDDYQVRADPDELLYGSLMKKSA